MANSFTLAFLLALLLMLALRQWLSRRQLAHVAAHRDQVPAQFAERIDLAAHQKAADYTLAKTRFGRFGLALETVLLLGFTFGGGLQALHEFWTAYTDGLTYGVALIFSVMLISAALELPLSLYAQFRIEERFGFNRMTYGLFFSDLAKQTLIGFLIGTPLLYAVLWLMSRMGDLWWLYVWLLWCTFNLLILFIYPTWIAPLFNKFTPLAEAELKARIEALLARCGFSSAGLFVMDGSKRSNHGNAYFTGFGRNKRIVFFDTLLGRLQASEVEAVLAHELGHFKRHHIVKRIALLFTATLAFLAILGQLIDLPGFYTGLGVEAQNTAMALILFFLIAPAFTFPLSPLTCMLSRRHEYEADAYAAEQTSAADLAHALVKLYEDNAATLTPDPIHSLFYDSHPPAALRVARLMP